MNRVWLCPRPRPGRDEDDKTIDASCIRALQTWDLPWQERRQGPHHWALYAHVVGGPEPRVEILRGADDQVRRTVARQLATIVAAEGARGSSAVMVSIGPETPEGFVFHVAREPSPVDPRMWWPLAYLRRVERQEMDAQQEANPLDQEAWFMGMAVEAASEMHHEDPPLSSEFSWEDHRPR